MVRSRFCFEIRSLTMEKEQMLTGEKDGGDMLIGGKKRKLISAHGKATKHKNGKRKGSKKSHKKVTKK